MHLLCSPAEALPEDEFFLDVAQTGEVSVVSEVDREAMGDTNNIYTVNRLVTPGHT